MKKEPQIMTVSREFSFEAAHRLTKLPAYHKCLRLHGHSYRVRIHCAGPLHPVFCWVVDYAEIDAATAPFIEMLDHRYINDVLKDDRGRKMETTAENLAKWLAARVSRKLPELSAVQVLETCQSSVYYAIPKC